MNHPSKPRSLNNMLVAFIGSSGSGKNAIISKCIEIFSNAKHGKSCTTKPYNSSDNYEFVSPGEFNRRLHSGEIAEHNCYQGHFYGTPASECDISQHTVLLDIDINGARKLKERFPDMVTIFIKPKDTDALRARLKARGRDTDEAIEKRIAYYLESELPHADSFDYSIVNDNLNDAVSDAASIIFQAAGGILLAFDGTAGCGKGTHAKKIAARYGGVHLDSGLIYRLLAYHGQLLRGIMPGRPGMQQVLDEAVANYHELSIPEAALRSTQTSNIVAAWSQLQTVRDAAFMLQMRMAYASGNPVVVVEGRDMTTKLFRLAKYKFFMDCPIELRAERRTKQYGGTLQENLQALQKRDYDDMNRPLHPLFWDEEGGVVKISSQFSKEETFATIIKYLDIPIAA